MDEVAETNAHEVSVSPEHYDIKFWTNELHPGGHGYAPSMRGVNGVGLEVRGWNPGGTPYAAAEDEAI